MLSPKEKAKWLVLKYLRIENNTKEWFNTLIAKQCAIILCNEFISHGTPKQRKYYTLVKEEIENL